MLKHVAKTFMKFLLIFILVVIAFTFSFCVILKPPVVHTKVTKFGPLNPLTPSQEEGTVFDNFKNIQDSFFKTLQMLSGEYTIEPFNLDTVPKKIVFFLFVLTSFVLFDLIIGLVISDIAELKQQADFLFLKEQILKTHENSNELAEFCNIAKW